jgi:anti-anti-sigma factor
MSTASQEPSLEVVRKDDRCLLRFTNCTSLNEYTADLVGQQLSSLTLDKPDQLVILDLANVEYLTSTILGHLVALHKRLKTGGGQLKVQNARPAIADVFRVTQLDHVLDLS